MKVETEQRIFELLTISYPDDKTGFYMITRAFKAQLDGDNTSLNDYLHQAKIEHVRFRNKQIENTMGIKLPF